MFSAVRFERRDGYIGSCSSFVDMDTGRRMGSFKVSQSKRNRFGSCMERKRVYLTFLQIITFVITSRTLRLRSSRECLGTLNRTSVKLMLVETPLTRWIGSVNAFMSISMSLVVGVVYDKGYL